MQDLQKNKMMHAAPAEKNTAPVLGKYAFPASAEWQPMIVDATSHEEAEKIYLAKRKPMSTGTEGESVDAEKVVK